MTTAQATVLITRPGKSQFPKILDRLQQFLQLLEDANPHGGIWIVTDTCGA
ncbi:hypothetical protein ACFRFU_00305 [Streptomyces sp. NPDC056704]|uniref:hypothetical protein n=1 Tax=Streptomyces TaxID=1883 RepID=UPI00332B38F4